MNRDSTVIQAAILLIIIAVLGVAIIQKQQEQTENMPTDPTVTITTQTQNEPATTNSADPAEILAETGTDTTGSATTPTDTATNTQQPLVEQPNSTYANIVNQYFNAIEEEDYTAACDYLSPAKCNSANPAIVANFQREYEKLVDGYEYVNVKDYGIVAPSGKHVVCVKYTYTYEQDLNPAPISEVLAFYLDVVNDRLQITDRVCEKKYKDGWGVRPCPIAAAAEFCEGNIK